MRSNTRNLGYRCSSSRGLDVDTLPDLDVRQIGRDFVNWECGKTS